MFKKTENKKIRKFKNKGFTLVETLVAISILSLSILSTFTAVQSGLSKSSFAKDQTTAFYLVQESMEYIRNIRDENQLKSIASISSGGPAVSWLSGISDVVGDPCYFGKFCYIDSPSKTINACSSPADFNSCPYIKIDSSTGLFGYSSGTDSKFKRAIQFQSINSNEVIVTIRIDWLSGVFAKSIQIKQSLFNIR